MKKWVLVLFVGSLMSFGVGPEDASKVTMTGQYEWNRQAGNPGDIRAEFTTVKDGEWNVAFYFEFRGEKHIYEGTASGSLTNGALNGRVQNEKKSRTWMFMGTAKDGKFQGTHVEIGRDGGEKATGTIHFSK